MTQRKLTPTKIAAAIGIVLIGSLLFATPATAVADKVAICHFTGSDKPYELIEPSASGVFNGHLGDSHQGGNDIIPPFEYNGNTYSQNWDAEGQGIFQNDCEVEECDQDECPSETTTTTSQTTTTTSETETSTQIPFFPTTAAIALGAGGILAAGFVMLRRRL
jgi:hypothetical protein